MAQMQFAPHLTGGYFRRQIEMARALRLRGVDRQAGGEGLLSFTTIVRPSVRVRPSFALRRAALPLSVADGAIYGRSGGPWRGERPVARARAREGERGPKAHLNHFDDPDTAGIISVSFVARSDALLVAMNARRVFASPSDASCALRQPMPFQCQCFANARPCFANQPSIQQRNMQTALCGIEHL